MSSFGGKINEIPQISVDNFDLQNLNSEIYFLSHCHSDHMTGLATNLKTIFLDKKRYLYASEVSCLILRKKYPELLDRLRVLDIYSSTAIKLNDEIISVTPIAAGHCPGSIMFLFETRHKTVLYTGDYRINSCDLKKFRGFYDTSNCIKIIDKLYLDTTFFLDKYEVFPPRNQIVEQLCSLMTEWMKKDEKNMINLDTPSAFGYESLFLEIYKRLKIPIHLSQSTYDVYKYFPSLNKATTIDGNITRIHSYCVQSHFKICKAYANVKKIKLSAMIWSNKSDFSIDTKSDPVRACYSTHASLEEGKELIRFLKPKAIEPCVQQKSDADNVNMKSLIQNMLLEVHGSKETNSLDNMKDVAIVNKLSLTSNVTKKVDNKFMASSECISGYNFFTSSSKRCTQDDASLLDSPPRKMSR